MTRRRHRPVRWGLVVMLAAVLPAGCQPKPKAPALVDEPVYQSDEGFHFLVPDGWSMAARGNLPPGPLDKERLLVQYRRIEGDRQATLEVSAADLPEDADLAAYLSGPAFSAERWNPAGSPEKLEAGGQPGTRYRLKARVKGAELAREVTAFRRGGRVYFFNLLYSPSDAAAPQQVRRAVGRLVWKD